MDGAAFGDRDTGQTEGGDMSMDWGILHWLRDTLTCPALDVLMPKITMLGDNGAVWLLTAGGLLCTKKYRK